MSLVNDSFYIEWYANILKFFAEKNVSSFCSAKATHIFSAKNIRILGIESAKTVNKMTLNELVKLMTLWTTGPWYFSLIFHNENTPIQIYWKFHHQKLKVFRQKFTYFSYICSKHKLWVLGSSYEYRQSMFLSRNKKNDVYSCKPQFYYIKVGFKGVKII